MPDDEDVSVVSRVPALGRIVGYVHKSPLWDRETFGDGLDSPYRLYFHNGREDAQGRAKEPRHANAPWIYPSQVFHLYGLHVAVDAGSDVEQAERFWNEGKIAFQRSQNRTNEWPARVAMLPPRGIPTSLVARTKMHFILPRVDVTVAGRPLSLYYSEQWNFHVECPGLEKLGVMLVLLGIRTRSQV